MENLTTFINIRTDYGFKRMFGTPENKHILIRLLNALLGGDLIVTDVVYHDKEMLPPDDDGKRIIYDIYCTSQGEGHHFILEMQNQYEPPFEDRVLYYTSRIIAQQGAGGWNYSLRPVISVVVTGFDFRHMGKALIHEMAVADVRTGDILTDKLRIFFLSLKSLGDRKWKDCGTEIEQIMYLIKNMDKMDKNSEAYRDRSYRDFFDAAETGHMASEDVVTYSNSLQRLNAIEAGIEYARNESYEEGKAEGMAEGRAEGMAEGLILAARNMMASGIADNLVMQFTGLTQTDLDNIRNS